MVTETPIPRNIQRIRASKGLTQEEVARKASITRNAFRSIETGAAEPRVSSLLGIARALGVALQELLTEPPRLGTVRFRSSKQSRKDQATRDQVVVEVARWLADFNGLEDLLDERKPYGLADIRSRLAKGSGQNEPVEAARLAREALGIGDDEPVRDICGLLGSAGVKVLTEKFNIEDLFGLSVAADDSAPAIVVNVRDDISVERRIFTAAHELGHLLLHPGAYDLAKVEEDPNEEKQADLFAGHFLVPDVAFQNEWHDTYGLPFVDRVLHVKRIFRVSYQTVLVRLVEREWVDSSKVWMMFRAHYKRRYGRPLTKKVEPFPLVDVDFLADRMSRLVRQAIESEKITLSRGAEILGIDLSAMRDRASSWEIAA